MPAPRFQLDAAPYAGMQPALRALRQAVLAADAQAAPACLEDSLDPVSLFVRARDTHDQLLACGRLGPDGRLGPVLVAPALAGQGLGSAVLARLVELGRQRGWRELTLQAPLARWTWAARQGFMPGRARFLLGGQPWQAMTRDLGGPVAVEDAEQALAACLALVQDTRRTLCIHTRGLDPGLLDQPAFMQGLRRFCTGTRDAQVQVLLHDALAPQQASAPLLALAQRLPSRFALRQLTDPVDLAYPSAFLVNDRSGHYFRPLGHRLDGETDVDGAGRARQLRDIFASVWPRARPCTELRALGL